MFDLFNISKKERRRQRLSSNRANGRNAEESFVLREKLNGNSVKRTGRGHDYKVTHRDIFGRATRTTYHEVKSSRNARLSELQEKTKKKLKGRYKVERPNSLW